MWRLCRVQASVLPMISYSMLCCSWSKQAGRSKLAKAVLKLVGASLRSSWSLPNPPGYPQNPADQCVHSPVVAREDVGPVLVGENLLSLNRMTPQACMHANLSDTKASGALWSCDIGFSFPVGPHKFREGDYPRYPLCPTCPSSVLTTRAQSPVRVCVCVLCNTCL